MTEKEMIEAYGKFTVYYQKWNEQRSRMDLSQLIELKEMVLDRIKIDHAYGRTAVLIDRDIQFKKSNK